MKDETKDINFEYIKTQLRSVEKQFDYVNTVDIILDYINNLQYQLYQASLDIQELTERDIECPSWCDKLTNLQEENERLLKIARKMHTWIFLNTGNEQKIYDEIGLTDKENAMLGYGGQFILKGSDK